jgi:hypothetical protein
LTGVATAIVGKAPLHWIHAEEDRFGLLAVDPCRSFIAAEQLALELGLAGTTPLHLVRVSLLDNRGDRRVQVGVLRPEEAETVKVFEAELAELTRRHRISTPGLVYAVSSSIVGTANGTLVQEISDDGHRPDRHER